MRYPCPHCGRAYRMQHWNVGQELECPNCQTRFVIGELPTWTAEDGYSPATQAVTDPEPVPAGQPHGPSEGASATADDCPDCGRTLYPIARLRPAPTLVWPARLTLAAGIAVAVVVYWGGILAIRSVIWAPLWLLAVVWLPVAILPAVGCGIVAYRFGRVVRHECRNCGWRSEVRCGR